MYGSIYTICLMDIFGLTKRELEEQYNAPSNGIYH